MMLPQPPRLADAALARYLRRLDAYLRAIEPRPSPDILPTQFPNGTTYRLAHREATIRPTSTGCSVSGGPTSLYGPPAMDVIEWENVHWDSMGAWDPLYPSRLTIAPGQYFITWIVRWTYSSPSEFVATSLFWEGGAVETPTTHQHSQGHSVGQPASHAGAVLVSVQSSAWYFVCITPHTANVSATTSVLKL